MRGVACVLCMGFILAGGPSMAQSPPADSYSPREIIDAGNQFFESVSSGLAQMVERAQRAIQPDAPRAAQSAAHPADLMRAGEEARQRGDLDEAIRLFGQVVSTRAIIPKTELAKANNARGLCYLEKGQFDKSIVDFSTTVRLAPKDPEAYNLRAWAHFLKGDLSQAIRDSTAALRLDPKLDLALRIRGRARLYAGQPKQAADDFVTSNRLVPSEPNGVLWLAIARARAKQENGTELEEKASKIDRKTWPGPILDLYLGTANPDQVRDKLTLAPDEGTRREEACDLDVYVGLLQLIRDDKDEAEGSFKNAVDQCPSGSAEATELTVAKMELKRLGMARQKVARRAPKPATEVASEEPSDTQ